MIVIKLDETHANQFLASMDSNHFNIKVFDDIKDQIVSQMSAPAVPAAAVAAFMAGVPHEQFDEETEEEAEEE
jgi:ribosomal protein L12E/L44/L45/RPP1/RPP2